MRTFIIALLASIAPFAVNAVVTTPCYNPNNYTDPLNITPKMARDTLNTLRTRGTTVIDLWIHMLVKGPTAADGYVDATGILSKVALLDKQFGPWGFQFQVKPISYAINAEWASDINPQINEKQSQLRRGDYTALNVYVVKGAGGGQCTLPLGGDAPLSQSDLDQDGCFIPYEPSTQDGPASSIIHEVGHWLGLAHVWDGGCTNENNGDFCDDTWPQDSPSQGHRTIEGDDNSCPKRDSCPNAPGKDNIRNFMDYTDCATEFTPCQGGRMAAAWASRKSRTIAEGVRWK